MHIEITQLLEHEICHHASTDLLLTSKGNRVFAERRPPSAAPVRAEVLLPVRGWKRCLLPFRVARRACRLDKMNVVPVEGGLVILHQGRIYRAEWPADAPDKSNLTPVQTGILRNCRNVLHQSICVLDGGRTLYFGEYGANPGRGEVPVWRSRDAGRSWEVAFLFPPGKIKHIHGCYHDPFEDRIWTLTGDFAGECYLLCSDRDFQNVEWIGNGAQEYRACNLFFEPDGIHWVMDSQLQDSRHIRLDRATRRISQGKVFPGPGWYFKRLAGGWKLATTAVEIGPGVHDNFAHVLATRDFEEWTEVARFRHDGLPKRYFKFGVLAFADGGQAEDAFYMFGEALRGIEGRIALCRLKGIPDPKPAMAITPENKSVPT
ncbi:MAG: hypothetical protein LBG65_08545 [Puniceicoccales bacterium]|jgi:hypothetical protein|nr:hypothetical protein [Puniceicoccales bacterium]